MKDSLLLPVVFLLVLILSFILFTLGYLMYLWDVQYVPADPPTLQWAVATAPAAMRAVVVPSVLVAFFLVVMRSARKPGIPLFSYLLALASVAAALYFGFMASDRFLARPAAAASTAGSPGGRSFNPLVAGYFNLVDQGAIYPEKVEGNRLGPTLIATPSSEPAFVLEREGGYDPKSASAVFAGGKRSVPVRPANPNFAPELAPRGFLAGLIGDMTSLASFLGQARSASRIDFLIALGGVALFSVACIGLAWVSRWPVMNVVLVAVAFRGLFWLFALFTNTVATNAFALVVPKRYMPLAPSIGLGALGVLFMLWTIFFIRPPARD